MAPTGPDASNSSLPAASPVILQIPPLPTCVRGERCSLDGAAGRRYQSEGILAYPSGKSVVVRNLTANNSLLDPQHSACQLPVLVYRGHLHSATAVKIASSGAYVASGDERGRLRVWALDHEEHLCKYETSALTGPIRDIAWDSESKRIVLTGERAPEAATGDCSKALQWDTGVSVGQLAMHLKGRASSISFKPTRPFRVVSAGKDDHKCYLHQGPPFSKIPTENGIPADSAHSKGAVNCVRYSHSGEWIVSVGTDRAICLYEGKTMELKQKLENVHDATIYACAWSADDKTVLTASGDGTCKLFSVQDGQLAEVQKWNPAAFQKGGSFDKVPVGGIQLGCAFIGGHQPVSVGLNGQLCLLPKAEGSETIKLLTGHNVPVAATAVDYANEKFYTGDTDGILCQWDLETCQPIRRLSPPEGNSDLTYVVHGGAISSACVVDNGTLLSVGWDDKMYVTDKTGTVGNTPVPLGAQPSAMGSGTAVAVIATVLGLLVVRGHQVGSMVSIPYTAQTVCVSNDDKTVYVGGDDCKVHVYSLSGDSLKESNVLEGHRKPVHSLALSNDGKKLASADVSDICVWNVTDNYSFAIGRGRWCFHVQRITCLSWSPDDKILASGGVDDSIYLWSEAHKMKRVHYPYAHRGGLSGLFWTGNYKFVSVGADAVVNLWDVAKDIQGKFA